MRFSDTEEYQMLLTATATMIMQMSEVSKMLHEENPSRVEMVHIINKYHLAYKMNELGAVTIESPTTVRPHRLDSVLHSSLSSVIGNELRELRKQHERLINMKNSPEILNIGGGQ